MRKIPIATLSARSIPLVRCWPPRTVTALLRSELSTCLLVLYISYFRIGNWNSHRHTKGGARRMEFCLFQGQLFEAEGEKVQYHLQGLPVAHLRRPVGGGLLPCSTRHLRYRKRHIKYVPTLIFLVHSCVHFSCIHLL